MTIEQFTQVVLELQSTLYHVARTQLYSSADREDAVQETLRRAWEKRDRLRDQEAVRVWLIRILLNVCHDIQKANKRMMPVERIPEHAEQQEEHTLLDGLMTLPPKYRTVIVMHYVEDMEVAEISYILRIPQGTVKSRLARGRNLLEKVLREELTV